MRRTRWFCWSSSLAVFACAAILSGRPAAAADLEHNGGAWLVFTAQGDFGFADEKLSRLQWWFDTQARLLDLPGGFGHVELFRPGLGWAFSEQGEVWLGYNFQIATPPGAPTTHEQQVWQQFTWSEPSGRFSRFWRTRLEERFIEGQSDVGVRLRQLFRTSVPIRDGSRFSIVGWDEIFFHLRDTDWGANAGFAENRVFLGFASRLDAGEHLSLEVGYMNQYVDASTNPNVMDHIASITLNFR